jgi:hypothetical protein
MKNWFREPGLILPVWPRTQQDHTLSRTALSGEWVRKEKSMRRSAGGWWNGAGPVSRAVRRSLRFQNRDNLVRVRIDHDDFIPNKDVVIAAPLRVDIDHFNR